MDNKDQKHNAQNRLLLCTALLTFLYYAEAKFQGISAIGSTIVFKNEDAVQEFLWVIWGYYFIRTYQYYKESGVNAFQKALNEAYVEELGYLMTGLRQYEFELLDPDDAIKNSKIRLGFGFYSQLDQERSLPRLQSSLVGGLLGRSLFAIGRWVGMYPTRARGIININLLRPMALRGSIVRRVMKWTNPFQSFRLPFGLKAVIYAPTARFNIQGQDRQYVRLPLWAGVKVISIYLRTILLRPHFTENQVPLIVGLAPVWYLIFINRAEITRIVMRGVAWLP